jgi:hypothetical protein
MPTVSGARPAGDEVCSGTPCATPVIGSNAAMRTRMALTGDKKFKVHLDGYNMIPYFTGEVGKSPRNDLIYFSDDGEVMALRVGDWKFNLALQRANQFQQWAEPLIKLRLPHIVSLCRDPMSEPTSTRTPIMTGWSITFPSCTNAGGGGGAIADFVKFPPRQKPASFNLDSMLAQLKTARGS